MVLEPSLMLGLGLEREMGVGLGSGLKLGTVEKNTAGPGDGILVLV